MNHAPFKILISHFRDDVIGGAEIAITDMVDMKSDSLNYTMLVPGNGALANFYRQRGYQVWHKRIETKRRKYPGLHTLQSFFFSRSLLRQKFDLVLSNDTPAASRVKTACAFAHIPHVIYVRTQLSDKLAHRKLLASADRILAVSESVRNQIRPMCTGLSLVTVYDSLNLRLLNEKINTHRTSSLKKALPFSEPSCVVGIIGRLQTIKQQDLFIKAAVTVLSQKPETRFVIVGSANQNEKTYEEYLHHIVDESSLGEKIVFMGFRSDALEIISELTILCLTSSQEGFPRTILEAQAVGCPVIAADIGGCPEMVEDGKTGLLFSSTAPDAEEQLAKRIIHLLNDEELRERLASQAKEKVLKTFAGEKPVRFFEKNLRSLIKHK